MSSEVLTISADEIVNGGVAAYVAICVKGAETCMGTVPRLGLVISDPIVDADRYVAE